MKFTEEHLRGMLAHNTDPVPFTTVDRIIEEVLLLRAECRASRARSASQAKWEREEISNEEWGDVQVAEQKARNATDSAGFAP